MNRHTVHFDSALSRERLISWLLAFLLVFTMVPRQAMADEVGDCDSDYIDDAAKTISIEDKCVDDESEIIEDLDEIAVEAEEIVTDDINILAQTLDAQAVSVSKGMPSITDTEGNAVELKAIGSEVGFEFKWESGGTVYLAELPYGVDLASVKSNARGWFKVFNADDSEYVEYDYYGRGNTIDELNGESVAQYGMRFSSYRSENKLIKDAQFIEGLGYEYRNLLADLEFDISLPIKDVEGLVISFEDEAGFGANESWTVFVQTSTVNTGSVGNDPVDPADQIDPVVPDPLSEISKIYTETSTSLAGIDASKLGVGTTGGEWLVLGLARAGAEVPEGFYDSYIAAVSKTLTEKNGVLHSVKYTEYSRVVLGLSALGYDVTDVAGYNLLEPLARMEKVAWQGINGPIFALLAFDSGAYEIPDAPDGGTQATREGLIDYILGKQLADGGWALSGSSADTDMTAMAIQALAPYYDKKEAVKAAIDRALQCLSAIQRSDGGYASWGTVNAESCAQVVVALCSMGIDPATDDRFIKNGSSVLDALASFAVEGGGFSHTQSQSVYGQMASEQGFYALAAYHRFKEGKTSLYDMTDVVKQDGTTPVDPIDPVDPDDPIDPVDPKPIDPIDPVDPVGPSNPVEPNDPTVIIPSAESGNRPDSNGGISLGGTTVSLGNQVLRTGVADNVVTQSDVVTGTNEKTAATRTLIADDVVPMTQNASETAFPWWWLVVIACAFGGLIGVSVMRCANRKKERSTTAE